MAWFRNNKTLASFIAFMVVGVGVLGYLLSQSMGRYDQVSQEYNTQVTELKRLQSLKTFPDQANLAKYEAVKNGYKQAVDDLQAKLAGFEPPPEKQVLTPTQFQDRLRKVVDDTTKGAQQAGVSYPEDFYLGFERYRNALPEVGAIPMLVSQLENIQELVSVLIREHVDKITVVKRAILPQESGTAADAAATPKGKGPASAAAATELVAKLPVVLMFTADPPAFRSTLNDITTSKRLFVIRALVVKNQADKGPARGQEPVVGGLDPSVPSPTPPTGVDPNAGSSEPLPVKGPPPLRYVLGQEKLDIIERVEVVKVAPRA